MLFPNPEEVTSAVVQPIPSESEINFASTPSEVDPGNRNHITAWQTYTQFAGLRSRAILSNRERLEQKRLESQTNHPPHPTTNAIDHPQLVMMCSAGQIQYSFDIKAQWRIGRNNDCDIVLSDQWVSRYHAVVQQLNPDEFYLIDLGSHNGSFVNGQRITSVAKLEHGDRLRIGMTRFEFYGVCLTQ